MTATAGKRVLVVIGAVVAFAVLLLHYKERDSYRCQVCWATKDVFQWRLGSWMGASVPLTPAWERVTETHFRHDFLPADHIHDWKYAQGSPYYFFGTTSGGCALGGGGRVNEVCQIYESSPEFRTFIQTKLRDGSLSKTNVVALMSSLRTGEASPQQKDADALLNTFFGR
jgi:hypothetical protein